MWTTTPPLCSLQDCIADPTLPIGMRMRSAYFLRHLYEQDYQQERNPPSACQEQIVDILGKGLENIEHGSLMRHEFAYVMGQLRDERGCPYLERILLNDSDCVMVRHEAAEALGAIGAEQSRAALQTTMERNPNRPELSETCQLALNVMKWRADGGDPDEQPAACACMLNPYSSVDPAPPHPLHANKTTLELGSILRDTDQPIFERYRAMFSLRNRGGADAVEQLCLVLTTDASSALLRHEVAYVLGQMQHPDSVEALEESLRRREEHEMVRHESAEALGAIEGRWDDVELILTEFTKDDNVVVRESCLVALDAADYWGHNNTTAPEDENEEESIEAATATFAQTKAVTNGKAPIAAADGNESTPPNRVLVNHFNIKD